MWILKCLRNPQKNIHVVGKNPVTGLGRQQIIGGSGQSTSADDASRHWTLTVRQKPLHPSSSSVFTGCLFGGRDGLICCQRFGGQMM